MGEMGVADRMKIFELLTLDVRERLKQKLPVYAVPTLFIPMLRLPLTPNAKVDRRALPFPGAAELLGAMPKAGDVDSRTDTEKDLAEIWSQHLPATADSLPRESSFYDLGGNSIMSVQIVPKINRKWQGVNVPMSVMAAGQPTLKSVGRYIDRSLNPVGLRLDAAAGDEEEQQVELYSNDLPKQIEKIPASLRAVGSEYPRVKSGLNILLTGATGFLGAYLMHDLLMRT